MPSLLAAATGFAFFLFYAIRLCPTLCLNGDSAELVTAAVVWGVPHAPGYPLFTAIGHALASLPVGDVAWRVHLTSAIFHGGAVAATVAATFAITENGDREPGRQARRGPRLVAAVAAGCALGLARPFVLGSLYAEVFPLNDLFFALLLFLAVRLRADRRACLPFAACAGLAAAHHMMIALAIPALAVLAARPLAAYCAGDRRRLAALVAAFVLPVLAVYALVPLAAARDPALSWGDVHDARSLLSLITRHDYGGLFSSVHGPGHGTGAERLAALGGLLAAGFGPVTLALAAFGAVDLVRRQRVVGASLLLAAFTSGPLFAWMNALGTGSEEALAFFERFVTMSCVPIAIAFGAGLAAAVAYGPDARRDLQHAGWAVLLAAWAVVSFERVRGIDLSQETRGIAFAHDLVLTTPDGSLLLLSGDVPANAALYVCVVERLCGARVALSPGGLFMPWSMAQTRRRHPELDIPWVSGPALKRTHEIAAAAAGKRPVFAYPDLLEKDPLLQTTFDALPDHLLFRLWPHGADPALERAAFLASLRDLRTGGDGCLGCALPPPREHPTQQMQLVHAYEAAATNHARAASALGLPPLDSPLPD